MNPRLQVLSTWSFPLLAGLIALLLCACSSAEFSSEGGSGSINGNAMDSGVQGEDTSLTPTHSEGTLGGKYDPNPDAGFKKTSPEKVDSAAFHFDQQDLPEGTDPIHDSIENGSAPSADGLATIKIPQKH